MNGESSFAISKNLKDFGIIKDEHDFDNYLVKNNYANVIHPGNYDIPKNATYDELAKILTKK